MTCLAPCQSVQACVSPCLLVATWQSGPRHACSRRCNEAKGPRQCDAYSLRSHQNCALRVCMSAGGCRTLVFGRYPAPGRVKTRLAAGTGADAACAFYSACLAHTVSQVSAWVAEARDEGRHSSSGALCYSDACDEAALVRWLTRHSLGGVELVAQAQDTQDLGVRLRTALTDGLSQPGISCAMVVGSDSPDLSPAILREAARTLSHHDVVFGPCFDGGYYLVGCRGSAALDALFSGVPWSSPTVLAVSLSLAQGAGLQVAPLDTLPTLMDIDQMEDLVAFLARARPDHPLQAAACAALAASTLREVASGVSP